MATVLVTIFTSEAIGASSVARISRWLPIRISPVLVTMATMTSEICTFYDVIENYPPFYLHPILSSFIKKQKTSNIQGMPPNLFLDVITSLVLI